MAKRSDQLTTESLSGLFRHHPYLLLFQKEDWSSYIVLLAEIYDLLEDHSARIPMEVARTLAFQFYSVKGLAFPEQKVMNFFTMAIGELQVLKDSHDQFGQRYLETTREGKALLQLIESMVSQRNKFSGTGAEVLLGALNDILISRQQMTLDEALKHHKSKISALREDMARIKEFGLAAAQLLPMAHSNEALFSQAEEAAIHVLQSIEDVKDAIEEQRKELAAGYFQCQRSSGETLSAVADFYQKLYASPAYASYIQAKELLSHLEGFQMRFGQRNVDRLLHSIQTRELVHEDQIKKSNLPSFMHKFMVADATIQEKIKAQIHILLQQVLYSMAYDVEGLRASLQDLLSQFIANTEQPLDFASENPVELQIRENWDAGGPVELFDFDLPATIAPQILAEEAFDQAQERELFLALLRSEEGTLKDILARLAMHLKMNGKLLARTHNFPRGLAEYYALSEIELFDDTIEKIGDGNTDLKIDSKQGSYVLRQAPAFILEMKEKRPRGKT